MIVASIKDKDLAALYAKLSEILNWPENIELFEVAIDQDGLRFRINSGSRSTALQAAFAGSTRPGLNESCGPSVPLTIVVAVVESPPGRSTKASPRSVRNMKPTRMLPPGSPPSWSSTGLIWRHS